MSTINVNKIGVTSMKKSNETDEEKFVRWSKILNLFQQAVKNKQDLFFPAGIYDVGNRNFPFRRSEEVKDDTLLDCSNITIYGEKGTVFKTSSLSGADVLQLNKVKNITIRDIEITATIDKNSQSGSNGVSITNGFDNITLENLKIYDLPGVDKGYWIDGGKGVTVQNSAGSKAFKGKIKAHNIEVLNSAYGFRLDTNHISDILEFYKSFSLDLGITVKKAFQGISLEFGESTKNNPLNAIMNIRVNADLTDCQQYVNFVRVIGGTYNFTFHRNQTYAQVLRDSKNNLWSSSDGRVLGFLSGYTKNAVISIKGNVGEVDNKMWIGVARSIDEPFNLKNRTENNLIDLDIDGVSKLDDIRIISYKGESINDNVINISGRTSAKKLPKEFLMNNNSAKVIK